ncbi:Forkhead box protein J3 [Cytospora mali]|uniref:Forkhead box protein J3 n=1 Tax=Cytospora mali TaxID=578113 RepID=A0A194UVR0_CYTMA|nr:Forkhead box protein J3 [Valsa mali var. pyri (nom. inval.)]
MAAHDTDKLDDFPVIVSPDSSSAVYVPSSNSHLKQPSTPCTTQSHSPDITDYSPGVIAGYYSPKNASREIVETSAPATLPSSSQNEGERPDGSQHDGVSQEALEDQCQQQQYCHEDLQQRMQGLWSSHPTEFDNYDNCNFQRAASDPAAAGILTPQPSTVWGLETASHNLPESDQHQLYCPSRLGLCSPAERTQPSSTSYSAVMGDLDRSHQSSGINYSGYPSATGTYQYPDPTSADSLPTTSLSPCSTTLAGAPMAMGPEDKVLISDPNINLDAGMDYDAGLYDTEDVLGSRSSVETSGGKSDEPYAQLIYRAFKSRQNKSMTLQEIYQWFRENTDKAKNEGKGWQNSIRHNLSMNGAFSKRSPKQTGLNSDGSVSLEASSADGRKSTEWFLEPQFYDGVESTTRYRKGNNRGASRTSRGSRLADGTAHSLSRVAAGRKGGYQAAQNRKKVKAEQYHHAARQHQGRHHHHHNNLQRQAVTHQYYPSECYPEYTSHHPHQTSPLSSPMPSSSYQTGFGVPAVRASLVSSEDQYHDTQNRHFGANNYFHSEDLVNGHVKRSRTLQSDNDQITEPTTPPGSALDSPMEDLSLSGSSGNKHLLQQAYVPEMMASHAEFGSNYRPMALAAGYPQQGYSLADAVVYEPPSGHQSPLFADRLAAEDAALFAANAGWDGSGPYYE